MAPGKTFCACQVWAAYSPVKNSPEDGRAKVAGGTPSHSATTGELDIYAANCRRARTAMEAPVGLVAKPLVDT